MVRTLKTNHTTYIRTLVDLAEFTAKGVCSPNVSAAECCLLQLAYVRTYGIDLHSVHNGCSYSMILSPFCSSSLSPPPNFPPLQTWSLLLPPSLTPSTRRTWLTCTRRGLRWWPTLHLSPTASRHSSLIPMPKDSSYSLSTCVRKRSLKKSYHPLKCLTSRLHLTSLHTEAVFLQSHVQICVWSFGWCFSWRAALCVCVCTCASAPSYRCVLDRTPERTASPSLWP